MPCPRVELQATNMCKVFFYGMVHMDTMHPKRLGQNTQRLELSRFTNTIKKLQRLSREQENEMCFHFRSRPSPHQDQRPQKIHFWQRLKNTGKLASGVFVKNLQLGEGREVQKQPSMAQSLAFTNRTRFFFSKEERNVN